MEPLYIFKFVVFGIVALVILVIASAAWFSVRNPGFRKDGGGDPELGLYLDRVDSIIHSVMAPELFDLVERLGELDEEFNARSRINRMKMPKLSLYLLPFWMRSLGSTRVPPSSHMSM